MKSLASEVYCRMMVYEKPTAILASLLGGEVFRELLIQHQATLLEAWHDYFHS